MAVQGPEHAVPESFAKAYAELQSIAAQLRPTQGQIPDVDAIEPMLKRANVLGSYCQERIEAVRRLIGEHVAE